MTMIRAVGKIQREINKEWVMEIKAGQIWRSGFSDKSVEVESYDLDKDSLIYLDGAWRVQTTAEVFLGRYSFVRNKGEASKVSKGVKADSNKRRYSLLPSGVVNQVVDVLEFGSKKYADDNWQKIDNARTRYYNAALRHIDAWWSGEIKDSETGKHHLAHAVCCLMFLVWFDGDSSEG